MDMRDDISALSQVAWLQILFCMSPPSLYMTHTSGSASILPVSGLPVRTRQEDVNMEKIERPRLSNRLYTEPPLHPEKEAVERFLYHVLFFKEAGLFSTPRP